jgi:DNA helicase HerA-like ATPase
MKEVLKLNNQIEIDLPKLIESKLLVQANSGGGKSWALRRILEQSHGKVQHIILDSEGEFGTLREKYDYVIAGKGGDTPAEPRSAALLARKLLELNVSAIIDLYELHPQERKRFVKLFLDSLINAPKELWHDCIVVIDEAHTYAPEKGQSEAMDAVIGLCALGRKRGFCAILATQRISKLSKDAAAECNNKLIGRASQDIDMKRAADELGFTSREQMLSLRALKPGEFYAFGPAISDDVQKVTVGEVQTTHPKAGSRSLTKVVPPTEGIKKILGKLDDLP